MTAPLSARLARLEAQASAGPVDVPPWLRALPAAVEAYLLAVIHDSADVADAVTRHPLYAYLGWWLPFVHRLRGGPAALPLRVIQKYLLGEAQARADLFPGVEDDAHYAAWQGWGERVEGAAFVRLWREHGTREPAALAQAGLFAEELALLSADSTEGGGDADSPR